MNTESAAIFGSIAKNNVTEVGGVGTQSDNSSPNYRTSGNNDPNIPSFITRPVANSPQQSDAISLFKLGYQQGKNQLVKTNEAHEEPWDKITKNYQDPWKTIKTWTSPS